MHEPTTALAPAIRDHMRQRRIETQLEELGRAHATLTSRQRELDEIKARIPFWDRVVFFSDTADEARARQLDRDIKELERIIGLQRTALDSALAEIEQAFPAFEIARRIDRAVRQLQSQIRVDGLIFKGVELPDSLLNDLHGLGERILHLYVPDFDHEDFLRTLADEQRCRAFANAPPSLRPHPTLGVEPLSHEALLRLLAGHVLDGPYFHARPELDHLEQQLNQLANAHAAAVEAVPIVDKLNVFTDSEAEQHRDQLATEVQKTLFDFRNRAEQVHDLLDTSLALYPPMGLYVRLGELLGAIDALAVKSVVDLEPGGDVVVQKIVEPRALVLAAAQRLRRAYVQAFPGVPLPSDVEERERRKVQHAAGLDSAPMSQMVQDFANALDRAGGEKLFDQCLLHVAMQHRLSRRLGDLKSRISWVDRLSLSNNADQTAEAQAWARLKWHQSTTDDSWNQLLEAARQAGAQQPTLALRDWAVHTLGRVKAIHTDGGSSRSPKSCSVYGRSEAYEGLNALRTVLEHAFNLQGDRQRLMEQLAELLEHPEPPPPLEQGVFRPRSFHEVLAILAVPLYESDYRARFLRLQQLLPRHAAYNDELQEVKGRISFWDRLNFFTDTPDEQHRDNIQAALKGLSTEIQHESLAINTLLERSFDHYPPARLYYLVGSVVEAVSDIRAVCRSRTVSTGSGKNRRTHTEYYCALEGHGAAINQTRRWNATLLATFGPQPTYQELLARWVVS